MSISPRFVTLGDDSINLFLLQGYRYDNDKKSLVLKFINFRTQTISDPNKVWYNKLKDLTL